MIISSVGYFLGGALFYVTYRYQFISSLPQFYTMALFLSQFIINKLIIRKIMSQHFNIPRKAKLTVVQKHTQSKVIREGTLNLRH